MSHTYQESLPTTYIGYARANQESLQAFAGTYAGVGYTDRIVRIDELAKIIGLSKSTIYGRLSKSSKYYDEKFPSSIKLGARSVGWLLSSVQRWLSEQA